jgi:hypothetical protein
MSDALEQTISEIEVDLDHDLICRIIDMHARNIFSDASYSIMLDVLDVPEIKDINDVYLAFGKAMFNEILLKTLEEKMADEECK